MKSRWSVVSLAALGLLVAALAFAADSAKQQYPGASSPNARAVSEEDGLSWDAEGDDFGPLAFADDDDYFAPGGGGMGMGPGGGMGMGMERGRRGGMGRHAGMGRGMGRGMRQGGGMGAFARLDLTDAQREKLADLHEKRMRSDVQARADLQLARMDLRKLMRAESPSTTAINAQIDKLTRLRADMQKAHVGTFLEARAMLTPEQQKQLRQAGPAGRGRGPMLHRPKADGGKSD